MVSRGAGRSAVAAAAYLSCSRILNEYDGVQHDYTRKQGLGWRQVFLPATAPAEWQDRETLWNAVEETETAKDSRLAREFVAALPIELSREEQIQLLQDFIKEQFVADGMCADAAIHDPYPPGHNPHAHILLTVRPLDEKGKWQYKTEKENLRKNLLLFCYQLGYLRKGKERLNTSLNTLRPALAQYNQLAKDIRDKTKERRSLLSEKKTLSAVHVFRHRELAAKIAALTEDLQELCSEKNMLLASLAYTAEDAADKFPKDIAAMEQSLKQLEEQEQKYSAELDAALAEYAGLREQAQGVDPVQLYEARQAIRPSKEQEAENRAQEVYGEKYSPLLMFDSKKAVSRMLHEEMEQSLHRETHHGGRTDYDSNGILHVAQLNLRDVLGDQSYMAGYIFFSTVYRKDDVHVLFPTLQIIAEKNIMGCFKACDQGHMTSLLRVLRKMIHYTTDWRQTSAASHDNNVLAHIIGYIKPISIRAAQQKRITYIALKHFTRDLAHPADG